MVDQRQAHFLVLHISHCKFGGVVTSPSPQGPLALVVPAHFTAKFVVRGSRLLSRFAPFAGDQGLGLAFALLGQGGAGQTVQVCAADLVGSGRLEETGDIDFGAQLGPGFETVGTHYYAACGPNALIIGLE